MVCCAVRPTLHACVSVLTVLVFCAHVHMQMYEGGVMQGGRLKPVNELEAVFRGAGVDVQAPLVCSCGSGLTACVLALALHQVRVHALLVEPFQCQHSFSSPCTAHWWMTCLRAGLVQSPCWHADLQGTPSHLWINCMPLCAACAAADYRPAGASVRWQLERMGSRAWRTHCEG
jgi:hypothetical protein